MKAMIVFTSRIDRLEQAAISTTSQLVDVPEYVSLEGWKNFVESAGTRDHDVSVVFLPSNHGEVE